MGEHTRKEQKKGHAPAAQAELSTSRFTTLQQRPVSPPPSLVIALKLEGVHVVVDLAAPVRPALLLGLLVPEVLAAHLPGGNAPETLKP